MIDLHAHTTCSDGTLTPEELVKKAKDIGLKAIAITDHDTVTGLDRGVSAANELGITFVPGVELEINYPYSGEFHLLGLGLKNWKGEISKKLEEIQNYREDRNFQIVEKMQQKGINVQYQDIKEIAGGDIIARPHFSKFLVSNGIAKDTGDAFKNFLNPGGPFYVPKKSLDLKDGIDLIHSAGGKAVIAHPQSLYISWGKIGDIFKGYKELGLDGLEAWHGGNNKNDSIKFEKIASDLRLIVSGGSDYHGSNIKERVLGLGAGNRPIPDIFLQNFI